MLWIHNAEVHHLPQVYVGQPSDWHISLVACLPLIGEVKQPCWLQGWVPPKSTRNRASPTDVSQVQTRLSLEDRLTCNAHSSWFFVGC